MKVDISAHYCIYCNCKTKHIPGSYYRDSETEKLRLDLTCTICGHKTIIKLED